jgi:hypothetical protein
LAETKQSLNPTQLATQIKEGVRKDGAEVQAERCADPQRKGPVIKNLAGLATAMTFMGANAQDCLQAIGEIR